ncbi:MAG TPA: DnaB-like helicase C-terminal domain-containing protein, partial [Polyangiales bacterium]|nr:DnaB-like helicase C-terminal domain-containing protein [Polyangiales bacterium]
ESREEAVGETSRGLRALAKELGIPVLALVSLNRKCEERGKDKRPMISDIRESGTIESDADTVLLLYRDEVYNAESDDRSVAEVIIGKQRNGPTGTIRLRFDSSRTRFDNLEDMRREDYA